MPLTPTQPTFNTSDVTNFVSRYKALTAPSPAAPVISTPAPGVSTSLVGTTPAAPVDRTGGIGTLASAQSAAALQPTDYADIQRQADEYAANQRDARIDAINTTFAPRLDAEQKAGDARIARVNALNFNAGIVGSGVDTTKTGDQKDLNDKALQAIQDQKALDINSAFEAADKLATDRAALMTTQRQNSADANVKLYQDQADQATAVLKQFGAAGKTLDQIEAADPNTIKTLREVSGLSDFQIQAMLDSASPSPTNVDTKIENGYLVASYYDPLTKKFTSYSEKLNIPATTDPKDVEIVTGKDGAIFAYNKRTNQIVNNISGPTTGDDAAVTKDLQDAQAAINAGASADDVRRTFLDKYPTKGDLFLKYTKQQY